MTYCSPERKDNDSTVAGKLVAVNVYHEQWVGLSLPPQHFRIKAVKKGIEKAHVEAGNQTRVRRPLTWEMIKVTEESIGLVGSGAWVGGYRGSTWLCR